MPHPASPKGEELHSIGERWWWKAKEYKNTKEYKKNR